MNHFLVEIEFKTVPDQEDVERHRAFLERITGEGSLLLAAIVKKGPGKGMAIIKAPSAEAAKAIYSEAPLAKKGVMGWTVTEITLTYGVAVGLER